MATGTQDLSSLTNMLKAELPELEGVEWNLELYKIASHGFVDELGVSIRATFKVPQSQDMSELGSSISKKVHEITSNGQVLLELEK